MEGAKKVNECLQAARRMLGQLEARLGEAIQIAVKGASALEERAREAAASARRAVADAKAAVSEAAMDAVDAAQGNVLMAKALDALSGVHTVLSYTR